MSCYLVCSLCGGSGQVWQWRGWLPRYETCMLCKGRTYLEAFRGTPDPEPSDKGEAMQIITQSPYNKPLDKGRAASFIEDAYLLAKSHGYLLAVEVQFSGQDEPTGFALRFIQDEVPDHRSGLVTVRAQITQQLSDTPASESFDHGEAMREARAERDFAVNGRYPASGDGT